MHRAIWSRKLAGLMKNPVIRVERCLNDVWTCPRFRFRSRKHAFRGEYVLRLEWHRRYGALKSSRSKSQAGTLYLDVGERLFPPEYRESEKERERESEREEESVRERKRERERESCGSAGARANRERLKFNDNRDGLGTRHRDRIPSSLILDR